MDKADVHRRTVIGLLGMEIDHRVTEISLGAKVTRKETTALDDRQRKSKSLHGITFFRTRSDNPISDLTVADRVFSLARRANLRLTHIACKS